MCIHWVRTPGRAVLTEACGEDAELRLEVQRMLVDSERADSFFANDEGATVGVDDFEGTLSEKEGDRVGPYILRQKIGEGGFGLVWMAEQCEPISRLVALKVVKAGMDTRQVLARFEAERQALAMMDHPNIAMVLDAGATASGRPYFAMELVKGIPITEFCNDQKFGPRERLELFKDVCAAVNHAHQKGIIHRDLKPSNVMVTLRRGWTTPVVKVIDFGIAKARRTAEVTETASARSRASRSFWGHPVYMSPEQAAMSSIDVDTRSDVYSAGRVAVRQLLTGARCHSHAKSLRSARAIDEPCRASSCSRPRRVAPARSSRRPDRRQPRLRTKDHVSVSALQGDLDWIIMRCLEKDRSRRYPTANGLAEDIERHLRDEPVMAGPPSARYRILKFVRRNRAKVVLGIVVASVLVLGLLGTSIGMLWALQERARADSEASLAREAERATEEAKSESDHGRYLSDIPRANVLLNEFQDINAREVLRNTPHRFRNFEWGWLVNRAWRDYAESLPGPRKEEGGDSARFWGSGQVVVMREFFPWETPGGLHGGFFSRDDKSVCFYHASGEVKRFSLASKVQTATFSTDPEPVIAIDLSPSGRNLVGFTFSNRAVVWNVLSEREPRL